MTKKPKQIGADSHNCECKVRYFAPAESLDLQACGLHEKVFLVAGMFGDNGTHIDMEKAWTEYLWNHGRAIREEA